MPREQVGAFLATSPRRSPSGQVRLIYGQVVHGFVCERDGFDDARDTPERAGGQDGKRGGRLTTRPRSGSDLPAGRLSARLQIRWEFPSCARSCPATSSTSAVSCHARWNGISTPGSAARHTTH